MTSTLRCATASSISRRTSCLFSSSDKQPIVPIGGFDAHRRRNEPEHERHQSGASGATQDVFTQDETHRVAARDE